MIKPIIRAALCCLLLMVGLTACTNRKPSTLKYRFATQEEGRRLKLANTDYICVPEECLAENFSFLISYGFFGRYDLTLDTRKVLFVPYATPALIRNIHTTLLEHFPKKD